MFKKILHLFLSFVIIGSLLAPLPARAENETAQNGLLAYVVHVPGGDGITYELHVIEEDGTDVATGITSKYSMTFAWSPDGTKLALGMRPDYSFSEPRIFVVNADGTNLHQVTTLDGDQPTWSPDSQQIAFVTRRADPTNPMQNPILYTMKADGTSQHRLGSSPIDRYQTEPKWSPDGQWLVFLGGVSGDSTASGIYRIAADGTSLQALALNSDEIHYNSTPSWTNDGQHVIFSSNRDKAAQADYADIYLMDNDGQNVIRLADTPETPENYASVAPDGNFVAYMSWSTGQVNKLHLLELSTGNVYEVQTPYPVIRYAIQPLFGAPVLWQISEPEPTPTPTPSDLSVVSVYRFWSQRFGNAHFFTIDENEAAYLYTWDPNWVYEGDAFGAYAPANGDDCKTHSAVYRFWSSRFQSHFFTADATEMARVRASDPNWNFEGVAYCADKTPGSGSVALHRFWSPRFNKHFFTADENEKNHLIANDPNWSYEGIAYYVQP